MKLPENSLFAILLRAKWWVSFLLGGAVFFPVRMFFGDGFGAATSAPFFVIGLVSAWKQLRRPSERRVARTLERARGQSWDEFCAALEKAFQREGLGVARGESKGADLVLTHQGLVTLVACKRWKATRTGVEPLKEFDAATAERGAHARMYVAIGEVTDNARKFAADKRIKLLEGEELTQLLG